MDKFNKWINSSQVTAADKQALQKMSPAKQKAAFDGELDFGTAGIRKIMGLGSSQLNPYTIKLIAYAWIKSLEKHAPAELKKGLIIGHDSRNMGQEFAFLVAQVVSGMGYRAILFADNAIMPTPLVSFTIRNLKLGGGACITASHNPPQYNGFKCFAEFGQHLMPAQAKHISAELQTIDINTSIKLSTTNISYLDDQYENIYLQKIIDCLNLDHQLTKDLKIIFSPQHGASYKLGPKILQQCGYKVITAPLQSIPDGNFPHTPDPNPENPAAFGEMIALGQKHQAPLLLTTDPDGDRIAVGALHQGAYYLFNGHEMASLITYYVLDKLEQKQQLKPGDYLIKTVVTTSLVDEIAASFNVEVKTTLTGFKYIGELIRTTKLPPLLATEESYGSALCPSLSLDKDALQLLPIVAEMATVYAHRGQTLVDLLHHIYDRYHYYKHQNDRLKLSGQAAHEDMEKLINQLANLKKIANYPVTNIIDYRQPGHSLPRTNLVQVYFDRGSWIAVRPSGTEPLLRQYYCIRGSSEKDVAQIYEAAYKVLNNKGRG